MERNTILGVLAVAIVAIAVGILAPVFFMEPPKQFPWTIERTADGSTRVFGLTLGRTTIAQAEQTLHAAAEINLFAAPGSGYAVEAYFDKIAFGGLDAKMILIAQLHEAEMREMYERGLRIATLGSGNRKVTLHPDDVARVREAPIFSVTYLPAIQLDQALLRKRFGEPAEQLRESGGDVVHWLYPELGLGIALSERGKDVLQYVPPREFDRLRAPLLNAR